MVSLGVFLDHIIIFFILLHRQLLCVRPDGRRKKNPYLSVQISDGCAAVFSVWTIRPSRWTARFRCYSSVQSRRTPSKTRIRPSKF